MVFDGISDYTDVRQILTDIRKSKKPKQVTIRNSRVSLEAAPKSTSPKLLAFSSSQDQVHEESSTSTT